MNIGKYVSWALSTHCVHRFPTGFHFKIVKFIFFISLKFIFKTEILPKNKINKRGSFDERQHTKIQVVVDPFFWAESARQTVNIYCNFPINFVF